MSVSAAAAMPWASRVAARVRAAVGWRRLSGAVLAGALSALAMAPFHLWPVLCLTLPILVWQIDAPSIGDASPRAGFGRVFWAGWGFGFGYFVAGLFWVGEAFLVEAEIFAWLIPIAVTLLPAGLALFWGAAAVVARWFWRPGIARVVVLAMTLAAAEWLRGKVLTGLPWNLIGYALTWPLELMQWTAYLGVHGLSLVTCLLLPLPLVMAADRGARGEPPHLIPAFGLVAAVLAAMLAVGHGRLSGDQGAGSAAPMVRIVQPSIPQREKWRPENQRRIFETHIALSRQDAQGRVDDLAGIALVVWPEAAMPFVPLATPEALAAIGVLLPAQTVLAAGALRVEDVAPERPDAPRRRRVYNSLVVLGAGGRPLAVYDKTHLVPFGEYLPLQGLLEAIGLQQLTRLRGGFTPGVVPRPLLEMAGLPPLAPLVCYEAIFPGAVVHGLRRPSGLLNVTNDGWFGNTTGPRQHFNQARVRAVEEGLPLIRAANNGISAMFDAYGHVVARLDLDVVGTIDARLPSALPPTLYARFGDGIFAVMLLALAVALAGCRALGMGSPSAKVRDRDPQ